jgi:hypothetical protein
MRSTRSRSSAVALAVARRHLDVDDFEVDETDLAGLAVWCPKEALRAALMAAFNAGKRARPARRKGLNRRTPGHRPP